VRVARSPKSTIKNQKSTILPAAVTAGLLMLGFNLVYYAIAAQVSDTTSKVPLDPAVLERFPRQIGDWTGQDVPLEEATRERTGADAILNRRYARGNGGESVGVYIASGITTRALVGHRPEVCFVSGGWTLMDHRPMELSLADGGKLPCTIYQFSRGMLDATRMTVLHYYIVDGQYCGNVSLLRRKAWRGSALVDYATQVRVSASGESLTPQSALRLLRAFAVDSAPSLLALFQDRGAGRPAGEPYAVLEGE
jgi:EpsI family protein